MRIEGPHKLIAGVALACTALFVFGALRGRVVEREKRATLDRVLSRIAAGDIAHLKWAPDASRWAQTRPWFGDPQCKPVSFDSDTGTVQLKCGAPARVRLVLRSRCDSSWRGFLAFLSMDICGVNPEQLTFGGEEDGEGHLIESWHRSSLP